MWKSKLFIAPIRFRYSGTHPGSSEPEAQISVEGTDHHYRELRVPNKLVDGEGNKVKLEPGAQVAVNIETDQVASETISRN